MPLMVLEPQSKNIIVVLVVIILFLVGVLIFNAMKLGPVCVSQPSRFPIAKENLTLAQQKLTTDLLQLIDTGFLPPGLSLEELECQMEQNHQLIHVSDQEGNQHTLVYVYITTNGAPDMNSIRAAMWNVTDVDLTNHLVVAWVDVRNLTYLTSFDSVQSIQTVVPPITRQY
jgi:hypothetical protein